MIFRFSFFALPFFQWFKNISSVIACESFEIVTFRMLSFTYFHNIHSSRSRSLSLCIYEYLSLSLTYSVSLALSVSLKLKL